MKATKIIALFAFACFSLVAADVMAQSDDDPPPKMSDYSDDDDAPPKMSDYSDDGSEVTESNSETVTIDENAAAESSDGSTSSGGFSSEPREKERLRIYSGKHDGNNVIYDPRR